MNKLLQSKTPNPPEQSISNDLSVISWRNYFEKNQKLKIDNDVFEVYSSGDSGVVCFMLHGGGFSALSWALLTKELMVNGGVRCVGMDMRGHGGTYTENDDDLSADTLASDVGRVVNTLFAAEAPPILLIGHSMGGAIAVRVANEKLIPSLAGLVVIDVVEGSAMEALSSMQSFLFKRPSSFPSLHQAISYCLKSGQIRNEESARISVIGQLKKVNQSNLPINASSDYVIKEDENEDEHNQTSQGQNGGYMWRVDLKKSEVFWKGWFEGLSDMFLQTPVPKMLLLAGLNRLDKALTIGQMQGKFQLEILPQCGHVVHEDCPDKVAEKLSVFINRFKMLANLNKKKPPS